MKKLLGLLLLVSTALYASVVYYGDGAAVFLENVLNFEQSGTSINAAGDKLLYIDTNGVQKALGVNQNYKELMIDPSFESITSEISCSNCAASLVTAITPTGENLKRVQLTFSAAGTATVDKTTGAGFFGLPSNVSCQVSTTNSDIDFAHRTNGANIATVDIDAVSIATGAGATTKTVRALRSNVIGTTSEGFQIIAGSAGDVYLDNCTISTEQVLSQIGYTSTPEEYTPVTQGLGTITVQHCLQSRDGAYLEIQCKWVNGTLSGSEAQIGLPSGLTVSSKYATGETQDTGSWTYGATAASKGGRMLATAGDTFLNFSGNSVFGGSSNNPHTPVVGTEIGGSGLEVSIRARVLIEGWVSTFDSVSDVNQNTTVTKLLTSDINSSTTMSDLTFSDLIIGAEYEVTLNARFTHVADNGLVSISLTHDSAVIGVVVRDPASNDSNSLDSGSITVKFTATASTLTFVSVAAGTAGILGNNTQSETFAQLRRIDNQINAFFEDALMSPGSSNGKPIILNNKVDASEVIISPLGDSIFISSCTDAAPSVCTLITTVIQGSPECWSQGASSYVSAADATTVTVERSAASTPFSLFCKGLQP